MAKNTGKVREKGILLHRKSNPVWVLRDINVSVHIV